jgi:hypothetical protein
MKKKCHLKVIKRINKINLPRIVQKTADVLQFWKTFLILLVLAIDFPKPLFL